MVKGAKLFTDCVLYLIIQRKKDIFSLDYECKTTAKLMQHKINVISLRKGKGQNGSDEVASASISMLPHSKRPEEKNNQSTMQALPMYAQVHKTEKTSNKGGAAQVRVEDSKTFSLKVT